MRTLIDNIIVDETTESLRAQIELLENEKAELEAELKRYKKQMNHNARVMRSWAKERSHLLEQM